MTEQPYNLESIEQWMQAVITHPAGILVGAASAEAREHIDVPAAQIEQVVVRSVALAGANRLAIYSHAYFARLQECLRAEFPVLLHALGDQLFKRFTFDYLQNYPPRSYTLNQLGEYLPRYLAESRPDADAPAGARESWPDFIIDLATLERTFSEVFDGPGVEGQQVLDPDQLPDSDRMSATAEYWRETRLLPVVCLKLIAFRYPVREYFNAVRNKESPKLPGPAETFVAMTRRNYTVRMHELTRPQYDLLRALVAGRTLGEAVRGTCAKTTNNEQAESWATVLLWLKDWADKGFFDNGGRGTRS